jgi:hypothetical protein
VKKFSTPALVAVTFLTVTGQVDAATLRLDGYTSTVQTADIDASPVANTPSRVGLTGFNITNVDAMESFIAWCLDISHYLMRSGASQDYIQVVTPYSNSYAPTDAALYRVQSVFDANYGTLDASVSNQAAAFQLALWEAAYEADGNAMSISDGAFQVDSKDSTALANTFLANGAAYTGQKRWEMSFFEVDGFGANRGANTGQNIVSVAAVPLPAAGFLLLAALFGGFAVSRRQQGAAR